MTKNKMLSCQLCDGTGVYPAHDGADDYDMVFCDCPAGQALYDEKMEYYMEAQDDKGWEPEDNQLNHTVC